MTHFQIVCFSRPGYHKIDGQMVKLEHGQTREVAALAAEMSGGGLYLLRLAEPYPEDYHETAVRGRAELAADARPALLPPLLEPASDQTLLLCYPNWFGSLPMPVRTYLDAIARPGLTLAPLCTNGGGGFGHSLEELAQFYPQLTLLPGLSLPGGDLNQAKAALPHWLAALCTEEGRRRLEAEAEE